MRVFVAGATGVLGVRVVRRLIAAGHDVVGLTRHSGKASLIRELGAQPTVADALDAKSIANAVRGAAPEAVIHLLHALPAGGPRRAKDIRPTNELRIVGTRNLLDASLGSGVRRFVAESMIFAYGYGDHGDAPVNEDEPLRPARGARILRETALAARSLEQQLARATATGRIETVALRFGLFYGGDASRGAVEALRNRMLPMIGGGRGVLSWVHVEDAADAVMAALERGTPGSVYNIVDDRPVTLRHFFGTMARAIGAPPPRAVPLWLTRLAMPYAAAFFTTRLPVSNAKAKAELGWGPRHPTYEDGIAELGEASSAIHGRSAPAETHPSSTI